MALIKFSGHSLPERIITKYLPDPAFNVSTILICNVHKGVASHGRALVVFPMAVHLACRLAGLNFFCDVCSEQVSHACFDFLVCLCL